jgi:hypothetical protein
MGYNLHPKPVPSSFETGVPAGETDGVFQTSREAFRGLGYGNRAIEPKGCGVLRIEDKEGYRKKIRSNAIDYRFVMNPFVGVCSRFLQIQAD